MEKEHVVRRHLSIVLICCTPFVFAACTEADYQPELTEWGTPDIDERRGPLRSGNRLLNWRS